MTDGSITISTKLSTEDIKGQLQRLKESLFGVGKTAEKASSKMSSSTQAASSNMSKSFINAKAKVKELEHTLAELDAKRDAMAAEKTKELSFLPYSREELHEAVQKAMEADREYIKLGKTIEKTQAKLNGYQVKMDAAGQATSNTTAKTKNASSAQSELASNMKTTQKETKKTSGQFKKMVKENVPMAKSVFRMANLFKLLALRMALRGVINALRKGFQDLAKGSERFNKSMSAIKSSTTQVRNAFASAFAPIIQALTPMIERVTAALARAMNALAGFTAAMLGYKTFTKATKAQVDYAESLENTAKAAQNLAGFDEINIIGENEAASTSPLPEDMFEEVEIPSTITDVVEKVKEVFDKIKPVLGRIKEALSPTFEAWGTAFEALKEPAQDAFDKVKTAARELWEETLAPTYENIVTDFIPGIANGISQNLAPIFTDVMKWALEEGAEDFEFFCQQIKRYTDDIFNPAMTTVKTIAVDAMESIKKIWDEYGGKILENLTKVKESFREIWDSIYEKIIKKVLDKIWSKVSEVWEQHLKPLWEEVLRFFAKLALAVTTVWNEFLAPLVKWIVETLGPIIAKVVNVLIDIIGNLLGAVAGAIKGIFKALGGLMDFITGVFTGDWKKAWEGIKTFFSGIWDGIWSIVKFVVNLIIDGINLLWKGIYTVVKGIVDTIGGVAGFIGGLFGQDWSFSMPSEPPLIPKLARGGIAVAPVVAQIGERGREAVLPLENNTGWMDVLADRITAAMAHSSGAGADRVVIPIYLDGIITEEYIVDLLSQTARRSNGRDT